MHFCIDCAMTVVTTAQHAPYAIQGAVALLTRHMKKTKQEVTVPQQPVESPRFSAK